MTDSILSIIYTPVHFSLPHFPHLFTLQALSGLPIYGIRMLRDDLLALKPLDIIQHALISAVFTELVAKFWITCAFLLSLLVLYYSGA